MNDTTQLLEQLGALEREYDDAFPHAWEDVIRGTRTAREVMDERRALDDPQELEALEQLLVPLTDTERTRWIDRLAGASVGGSHDGASTPAAAEGADAVEPTDGAEEAGTVLSLDARRSERGSSTASRASGRGSGVWLGAVLAVAAAVALTLWLGGGRTPSPEGASGVAAEGIAPPAFSLAVRNESLHGMRAAKDETAGPDRYQPSTRVHWMLQPEHTVTLPLGLRVLAESADGTRRVLAPPGVRVFDRGVIELAGTFEEQLGLPSGRWTLRLLVGAPDRLPDDPEAFDRGGPWTTGDPYAIEVVP